MKFISVAIGSLLFFSADVFSHRGGTDENGCHAGSQPFHCHNDNNGEGSAEYVAWDINFGFQYLLPKTTILPYIGVSSGESSDSESSTIGWDLGLKFNSGLYFGYVSTSKSFQLGYKVIHLSISDDLVGIGFRIPSGFKSPGEFSSLYISGSGITDQ